MLKKAISMCEINSSVSNICTLSDQLILQETSKYISKTNEGEAEMVSGISLPTSITINNICSKYSPDLKHDYILKLYNLNYKPYFILSIKSSFLKSALAPGIRLYI